MVPRLFPAAGFFPNQLLVLSKVASVGLGDWPSACFLSRYRNNRLVLAWAVCKYPSVYRTKEKEGNKLTSIKLFLGSRDHGWCFLRLFAFRYYPFVLEKADRLLFLKHRYARVFFLLKCFPPRMRVLSDKLSNDQTYRLLSGILPGCWVALGFSEPTVFSPCSFASVD